MRKFLGVFAACLFASLAAQADTISSPPFNPNSLLAPVQVIIGAGGVPYIVATSGSPMLIGNGIFVNSGDALTEAWNSNAATGTPVAHHNVCTLTQSGTAGFVCQEYEFVETATGSGARYGWEIVTGGVLKAYGDDAGNIYSVALTASRPACTNASSQLSTTCAALTASAQGFIPSPVFPANTTTFFMQGLANTCTSGTCSITPASNGKVLFIISGTINAAVATTVNNGVTYEIYYGTGTAPANAAAVTGTQCSTSPQTYTSAIAPTAVADVNVPFSIQCIATGLTLGTTYWFDLAAKSVTTASQMGLVNVSVSASEL